ncbi:MAG: response regulator transcription factor [Acidobacteria bacterium]|nr:response regulator transcription factor [Acidobacteriota bacterium]
MDPPEMDRRFIRVIVADSQAIFRAGLRKTFAVEDDIRVVGQAETLQQALSAARKFSAEILIFEARLAENPVEAVQEIMKTAPGLRMVVVIEAPEQELTLELFRRGAQAIVSRGVDSALFVDCLRTLARGEPWLEPQAVKWVLEAFRAQGSRPHGGRSNVQLTPKESLIVACVTQGMKNKEIAARVGTTEQVVKNYLRKIYDKLGVADRLELALYCLNNRVVLDPTAAGEPTSGAASGERPSPERTAPATTAKGDNKEHSS